MVKALYITTRKIVPLNTGAALYSYGILQYMKELGISTTYVSFYDDVPYTPEEEVVIKKVCDEIEMVKLNFQNTSLNFSVKYPNNIRKYIRNAMKKKLIELAAKEQYTLLVVDHVHMFEYAKLFPKAKIVLIEHNIEANLWKEYASRSKGLVKALVSRSAEMLTTYEINAVKQADRVISIADTDAAEFIKYAGEERICIMHPYNLYEQVKTEEDIRKTSGSITFIGGYNWYPNQKAAQFLAEELMPILRSKYPGIKLYLVGKNPTEEMQKYAAANSDIIVTGMVDSVDPYIKDCDVFVNAMFEGSGMNIKMMEAMGKGIPLVTSVYGYRGIDVEPGKEVLVFETAEECAEQILELINDKEKAVELSHNARAFYRQFIEPDEKVRKAFLEPKK